MKQERGFSVIELIIVTAIIGIMAVIAIPTFIEARQNAAFRQEARSIGAVLREARGRTVSLNREHQFQLDLTVGANRFRLMQGNASSGSAVWAPAAGLGTWNNVQQVVVLAQAGCAGAAPFFTVEFNTNGSADSSCTIQVQDTTLTTRYSVSVTQNTGRVRIQ